MKKLSYIITVGLFVSLGITIAQCPPVKEENYKKVMSTAFAKEFRQCSVKITGVFYKEGYMRGYRKPPRIRSKYFFQCLALDAKPNTAQFTGESMGDIFVTDKEKAEMIWNLSPGDTVDIIGTTYVQNYYGLLYVYFMTDSIAKSK